MSSPPPAGFWPDSLTALQAASATAELVELRVASGAAFWSCYQPDDGRTLIWRMQVGEPLPQCHTPQGFSVRSRVNEYGGGSFAVGGGVLVFVNEADQQLYVQPLAGSMPQPLTRQHGSRFADMDITPCGRYLVAVEECHQGGEVTQRLVRLAVHGGVQCPLVLIQGADFYSAPRISGDGRRLAWVSWQKPHQPWTRTRLYCAQTDEKGGWQAPVLLAGGDGSAAIQQPLFDSRHRVLALNDQAGFWQPWREREGQLQPLPGIRADHAGAPWQMGGCNFLPLDGRYLLVSWFEQGFGKLGLYDSEAGCLVCNYLPDYSRMRHLACDDDYFYCIAGHPVQGAAVLAIRRIDGQALVLQRLDTGIDPQQVSRPQALECVTTGGQLTRAFFYPPRHPQYRLAEGEKPPLVIFLHGGPTSAAYPVFDARIQFWTRRGFAVADLNYRGSTGFGRAYRQALAGRWGERDVEDVLALVDELKCLGWVDDRRLCVRGASAGGYTSLMALTASDVFAAAASWYGVSDPLALDRVTHRFEGDYLGWLLGELTPANRAAVTRRAPLMQAGRIRTPVIFFQGGQDVVVVPEQTRDMVRQLCEHQVEVEYHEFAEQGHGFRCAKRLGFALQAELEFYRRQFAVAAGS